MGNLEECGEGEVAEEAGKGVFESVLLTAKSGHLVLFLWPGEKAACRHQQQKRLLRPLPRLLLLLCPCRCLSSHPPPPPFLLSSSFSLGGEPRVKKSVSFSLLLPSSDLLLFLQLPFLLSFSLFHLNGIAVESYWPQLRPPQQPQQRRQRQQ